MARIFWGIMIIAALLLCGCSEENDTQQTVSVEHATDKNIIVAVGDSLTAGMKVDERDSYPALLEEKLRSAGYNFQVINAGVSGETSSGTLSRIEWVMTLKPDVIILETGANDGLRGIDPVLVKENIG
ncbi:MAG: GDSL-type esterase/lipase family protein, partial [Desulforhopalus sp.]